MPAFPNARQWHSARVPVLVTRPELMHNSEYENTSSRGSSRTAPALAQAPVAQTKGPPVITVHRGATGLNLQHEAGCIVCRPQPGDLVEQMKGRIDRPGQRRKQLVLVVMYTAGTVEEVEAANTKRCCTFFCQYLDPLSVRFQVSYK